MHRIVAVSCDSLQVQFLQWRAYVDRATLRIEQNFTAAAGKRTTNEHQASAVRARFDAQGEAARKVLHDLFAQPAGTGVGFERHTSMLQPPCLSA